MMTCHVRCAERSQNMAGIVAMRLTIEQCRQRSLLCETRTEFFRRFKSAYLKAWRCGALDDVCGHMPVHAHTRWKWPLSKARCVAAEYSDLSVFRKEQSVLFGLAWGRGWLEELTAHMRRERSGNGHWTKCRVAEVAEECETRTDFFRNYPGAYDVARKNGWLDHVCAHMRTRGTRGMRVVYIIRANATKCAYIGISFNPTKRYAAHKRRPTKAVAELMALPHTFKVLTLFIPTNEACRIERALIERFQSSGWILANRATGGQPGSGEAKWTLATLTMLARSLETRGQMMRGHLGAYTAACSSGLLDEIFADHPNRGFGDGPIRDWTHDRLQKIADRCGSRAEMKRCHPKAWHAAHRRGLLDELFAACSGGRTYREWTEALVRDAASRASSAAALRRDNPQAWKAAYRRGLLKVLFPARATTPSMALDGEG